MLQLPSGFRTPIEEHPENRMHQALRSNLSSQPPLLLWELSKEMQMGWKWEGCSKNYNSGFRDEGITSSESWGRVMGL